MKNLKYTDILKANKALGEVVSDSAPYGVKVISNIITSQFNEIFEYVLRQLRINVKVTSGDYDNILQDSQKYSTSDTIIIFWELSNLIDGLQYKADTMDEEDIINLIEKTKNEIDFVFQHLARAPNVILNKFSTQIFNYPYLKENAFDRIGVALNKYTSDNLPSNFTIIDIERVFAKLSIGKSTDLRFYYSSKSLYSIEFYKEYANYISPVVSSLLGKSRKALIFDCDNTLWKGIVGEDGVDGIGLSAKDKGGNVFEEVHHLARALSKQGILLGLCSKNNPDDVDEVFKKRADFALRNEDIVIKKVNWSDKVGNIREIAAELNIGIESVVFIDDSSFEVNYVRDNLPGVSVLQVTEELYNYPSILRENARLFYKKATTKEDNARVSLYKTEESRKLERSKFASLEQYLLSLGLIVTIFIDDERHIERAAQLSQKTNQFNFTTFRYTESEIGHFIRSEGYKAYVFNVADKFGDYGITGMAIIRMENAKAELCSFLMSCRIIGRNIEIAFLNFVLKDLRSEGIEDVSAKYISTIKNSQVLSFYENFGFEIKSDQNGVKEYSLALKEFEYQNVDYITLKIGK